MKAHVIRRCDGALRSQNGLLLCTNPLRFTGGNLWYDPKSILQVLEGLGFVCDDGFVSVVLELSLYVALFSDLWQSCSDTSAQYVLTDQHSDSSYMMTILLLETFLYVSCSFSVQGLKRSCVCVDARFLIVK